MPYTPSGPNNRANPYYGKGRNTKLARGDYCRSEFFGTVGGVPSGPIDPGPYEPDPLVVSIWDGKLGDVFLPNRNTAFTRTAGGVYEPVTTTGDQVSRVVGELGLLTMNQLEVTRRPLYGESGAFSWLDFDQVNDRLAFNVPMTAGLWDVGAAYAPTGNPFILMNADTADNPWIGIGQSGSGSDSLSGFSVLFATYFNNVAATPATRGEQYTLAQASSRMTSVLEVGSPWTTQGVGQYVDSGIGTLGRTYAFFVREDSMTVDQRDDFDAYLQTKVA